MRKPSENVDGIATLAAIDENAIYLGEYASPWQVAARERITARAAGRKPRWPYIRTSKGHKINGVPIWYMGGTGLITSPRGAKAQAIRALLALAMEEDLTRRHLGATVFDESFHYARIPGESPWVLMRKIYVSARNRDKAVGGIGRLELDKRAKHAFEFTATGRYHRGPPKRKTRTPK